MIPQLDTKVLRQELAAIRQRRLAVFAAQPVAAVADIEGPVGAVVTDIERALPEEVIAPPLCEDSPRDPDVEAEPEKRRQQLSDHFQDAHAMRPFGVAFSGGGIRSATFNLGILQGLAEIGLLKYVDYLSTVSGGGYIGGWLHGLIRNRCHGDVGTAEHLLSPRDNPVPASPEDDPVTFLRKYSNYLAPRPGLFSTDSWVIGSIWLRNVLLNQLILAPTLCAVVLLLLLAGLAEQFSPSVLPLWLEVTLLSVAAAVPPLALGTAVLIATLNLHRVKARMFPDTRREKAEFEGPATRKANRYSGCVAPLVFIAAIVLAHAGFERSHFWSGGILAANILILFVLFQLAGGFPECYAALRARDRTAPQSERRRAIVHVFWMAPVSAAASVGLLFATWSWAQSIAGMPSAPWQRLAFGPPLTCLSLLTGVSLLIGLMGADYPDAAREWLARVGATVALLCAGWVGLFVVAVFGPVWFAWLLDRYALVGVTAIGGWGLTTAAGVIVGHSTRSLDRVEGRGASVMNFIISIAPTVFMVGYLLLLACLVHIAVARVAPSTAVARQWTPSATPTVYDLNITNPRATESLQINVRTTQSPAWLQSWLNPVVAFEDQYWTTLTWNPRTFIWILGFLTISSVIAAVGSWRFNINEFSLHHFYKNRLVRCYLGASNGKARQPNKLTGFDPLDDFPLSSLVPARQYSGPYAIVNAALNLNMGSELAQQERKASSFVFTPGFCGFQPSGSREDNEEVARSNGEFEKSGYRATAGFTSPSGPHLGTTMAISGAAANPNSGYHTSGPMAFLLTVFDARLGWWLGNPRRPGPSRRAGPDFAWGYLFYELLGFTTGRSKYVNVSDGGHFENLGLYELVRRRCRYIIIGDGEQDGSLTFDGLGGAIRKCRADFGVEININPEPIRLVNGFSNEHCVVGTIRYPENETGHSAGLCDGRFTEVPHGQARGWLLYLKSSVTGDEPADVLEYRSKYPEFPHQSTSDQFFSESQFESYRRLGLHVVKDAFEGVYRPDDTGRAGQLLKVFGELTRKWYAPLPVTNESAGRLAESYSRLVQLLGDKTPQDIALQLLPRLEGIPKLREIDSHSLAVCLEAIQLMQNVFSEFDLEFAANRANPRNAGWMSVFRRWARSPLLYDEVWDKVRNDYNPLFQKFVDTLHDEATEDWPDRP
jgi:hypothetical protein